MLEFELSYLRKIKIWFKQNNDLILQGGSVDRKMFLSRHDDSIINSTVIIELFIPRGGRNIYGIFGADYSQFASNNILVSVSEGNIIRPKLLHDSFVAKVDTVKAYLPEGTRGAIFEEINLIYEYGELNMTGKLDFRYGGYSEISSSDWIFRKLTKLVVGLLNVSEEEVSLDLLSNLIDA